MYPFNFFVNESFKSREYLSFLLQNYPFNLGEYLSFLLQIYLLNLWEYLSFFLVNLPFKTQGIS